MQSMMWKALAMSLCLYVSLHESKWTFVLGQSVHIDDICNVPKLTAADFIDRCHYRIPYICSLSSTMFSFEAADLVHKEVYLNATHLHACPCLTSQVCNQPRMSHLLSKSLMAKKQSNLAALVQPRRLPAKTFNIAILLINTLLVLQGRVAALADNYCETKLVDVDNKSTASSLRIPSDSIQIYADFLRRRWSSGSNCTTHILVLIVERFAAPGDLYFADTDFTAVAFESKTFLAYLKNDSELYDAAKELADRKHASGVQERVKKLQIFLKRLDYIIRSGERPRSTSIPHWALGMLIFCSIFGLVLAIIGGRVNTSRTGVSAFRMGKSSCNRQWKAGFSGGVWAS